ncbi:MAG: SoxR reducing system RseC family protein [Firmicutes bacterium]|nr:SoxR reducing system RseC family protein [Bacillota bacterium]
MASTQIGQVVTVGSGGHTVTVEFKRESMCSHGSCSHRIFPNAGTEVQVEAVNSVGALVGDFVEVSFKTRAALWAAFLVYVAPILAGLGFYLLAGTLSVPYPAILGLAAAIGAMLVGLKRGNRLQIEYTVISRLDPDSIHSDRYSCIGCPFH